MITNDEKTILELSEELGFDKIFVDLLFKRGYRTADEIKDFLIPTEDTPSPFCMSQIRKAADRIKLAVDNNEKILIFGDYDCDGICSTSILKLYFDSLGVDCVYHIPRRSEGYGLSVSALEKLIEEYLPDLIVTVDCGISSVEEVELCFDLGVDIIVTDHHEPQDVLPDCIIVNPKIDENSPLRDLCGAGVAYKLVEALSDKQTADQYLDLAAIATVADIVPLLGANRSIVYYGLKLINQKKRLSVKRMTEYCSIESVGAQEIGFRLAPRINAPGRLDLNIDMVEYFTSDDNFVIDTILEALDQANAKRQSLTKETYEDALKKLTPEYLANNKIIVLYSPNWPQGILGLVASKLTEEFYRPTVLLTDSGEVAKGSARSIDGVNIFKCLSAVSDYTVGFGGHEGAAGMSVAKSRIKDFATALQTYCRELPDELFVPKKNFDVVIDKKTLTKKLCKQFALLEPTGERNPTPIFAISSSECKMSAIPNSKHIKGVLNSETDLIGFSKDAILNIVKYGAEVEMYGFVAEKEYKNRDYVQFTVNDYLVKDIDGLRDNAVAFSTYLKTGLVNAESTKNKSAFRVSELQKEIDPPTSFGNLYIAYSRKTADEFLETLKKESKSSIISRVSVGVIDENPVNTLCLLPSTFDSVGKYSTVVFLDSPISSKFVNNLANKYIDTEFVLLRSFGYKDSFVSLKVQNEDLDYTVGKIYDFVKNMKKAKDINDLFFSLLSVGYKYSNETFYTHFYVLYEIGWLKISSGFALSCYASKPNYSVSVLLSLVKQIKNYFSR